jgi:hypothetical protein
VEDPLGRLLPVVFLAALEVGVRGHKDFVEKGAASVVDYRTVVCLPVYHRSRENLGIC